MKKILLRLKPELYTKIKAKATENERSVTAEINYILKKAIK